MTCVLVVKRDETVLHPLPKEECTFVRKALRLPNEQSE